VLVAAALVPDTALLVPGAAGATDVLADLRDAAARAVGRLPGAPVVVVAPGPADREVSGQVTGSLSGVGVPDEALRWPVPSVLLGTGGSSRPGAADVSGRAGGRVPASGTAVALHLLARAGREPARVLEVVRESGEPGRGERLRALGASLVADGPVALVVVGSLSARHGPDAPLADDPAAAPLDAELLTALAGERPAAALDRLGEARAGSLAVSGWAPWQVLAGALGSADPRAEVLAAQEPFGAAHAVLSWLPAAAAEHDASPTGGGVRATGRVGR